MPLVRISDDPVPFEAACGLGGFGWKWNGPEIDETNFGVMQGVPDFGAAPAPTLVDYGEGEAPTYLYFACHKPLPTQPEDFGTAGFDGWVNDASRFPDIHLRIERSGSGSLAEALAPRSNVVWTYEGQIYLPAEWEAMAAAVAEHTTALGELTIFQWPFQRRNGTPLFGALKASGGKGKADKVQWWPWAWDDVNKPKIDIANLSDICGVWSTWKLTTSWYPREVSANLKLNGNTVWSVANAKTWENRVTGNYMKYGFYLNRLEGTTLADRYNPGTTATYAYYTGLKATYEVVT